jgi:hypothetical protein
MDKVTKSAVWRIIFSVIAIWAYFTINTLIEPIATLTVGSAAGAQMNPSDAEYMQTMWTMAAVKFYGLSPLFLGIALLIIWYRLIKNGVLTIMDKLKNSVQSIIIFAVMCGVALAFLPTTSYAYYDRQDWPEYYYIKPNETCFYVPDVGDNQEKQAKFMSLEYLEKARVAAKRFQIPHTKLPSSSYWKDFVVPAGRLHCVERKPYARSWTANASTGTSAKNESFRCQSADGVTASADLTITATITESGAFRYLYWFGVTLPQGDQNDPKISFTSVFYARKINTIMDDFVSKQVLPIICSKFSTRSVDVINKESAKIQADAQAEAKKFLDRMGIELLGLGWGNIDYSDEVQQAIDKEFSANKIARILPTLERQADLKIKYGLAKALEEKGIPMPENLAVVPDSLFKDAANAVKILTGK